MQPLSTPLPSHHPWKILEWGVCRQFHDPELLQRVTSGRDSATALDVLDFPIRAVDKLWVCLRKDMLPEALLDRILDRVCVFPGEPEFIPCDEAGRDARLHAMQTWSDGDYWLASRRAMHVFRTLGTRSPADETERQYAILVEELSAWMRQRSQQQAESPPAN